MIRLFVVLVSSPVVAVIALDLSLDPFPRLLAADVDLVGRRLTLRVSVRQSLSMENAEKVCCEGAAIQRSLSTFHWVIVRVLHCVLVRMRNLLRSIAKHASTKKAHEAARCFRPFQAECRLQRHSGQANNQTREMAAGVLRLRKLLLEAEKSSARALRSCPKRRRRQYK
jgi:hypothetical protein